MGTSGTESCEGCLDTQFKHLPQRLALKLSPVRLSLGWQPSRELMTVFVVCSLSLSRTFTKTNFSLIPEVSRSLSVC